MIPARLRGRLAEVRWRGRLADVVPVGGGLALVGLSAYAVLALAGHVLAPRDFAAVGSLYLLVAILGPGMFVAVEQQANREVSGRIATGIGYAPVLRTAALVSGGLAVLTSVGVLALSPILVARVFGGSWALLTATVLAVLGAAAAYLLRGVFAGQRRYRWYGASLAAEGLARFLPCVALVLLGVTDAGYFGLVFGLGLGLSAAVTLVGLRRGDPGPPVPVARMSGQVGLLSCASGLTLLVANLGPVVLTSRLSTDPRDAVLAASFVSLFVLARIPLFLFAPLQAFLLPTLTAAAGRGAAEQVRNQVRTALGAVAALGGPGILLASVAGPWASRVFFDAPMELSWLVAGLLGVGTVGMMAAQVLQPALVALGRNRVATGAWMAGAVLFTGLLLAPGAPLVATVAAQVAAPALVTAVMLVALRRELRGLAASVPAPGGSPSPSNPHPRTRTLLSDPS